MTGSSPTVLFIRHDPDAHPGYVGAHFARRGFQVESVQVVNDHRSTNPQVELGDPGQYDVIVPLGAVFSLYDHDAIGNWIGHELSFLAEAHRRDIPVLGICFGGQALSAALGGTVERSPEPEIGWRTIDSDKPEAVADGPWMQWHYDRFTVPAGATELARSDVSPQAFTIGRSLGLQFHPEVSSDIVNGWLDGAPPEELDKPEVDVATIRRDSMELAPQAKARTERLVDWFLDDLASV